MSDKPKRNWLARLRGDAARPSASIDQTPWSDLDWIVGPGGVLYPLLMQQTLLVDREHIAPEFTAFARQIYKANPIVFACIANRMALFSEATFRFRELQDGRPGRWFGNPDLLPLEQPWPGATTGDLLALAELYVSLAGNFFCARRRNGRLRALRPDWMTIVLGSNDDPELEAYDIDAEPIGYIYQPGGYASGSEPVTLLPEEVAHFMPAPDPECPWRGMSWLSPVLNDVLADKTATTHKQRFLENGTGNMIVKPDITDPDQWDKWVEKFRSEHEGAANRFRTLFLAAGVDATVVGANLTESDFVKVQNAGETRICADAMVPPSIVAISDGLQGSALNAGNFEAAWRQFANGWARPSWRRIAGAFARIIPVPGGAQLCYDDRDIPALQEDAKKRAETLQIDAQAISTLITAGYEPDSVIAAVTSDDLSRLTHTGLTSVQLLPPGQGLNGHGAQQALEPAR